MAHVDLCRQSSNAHRSMQALPGHCCSRPRKAQLLPVASDAVCSASRIAFEAVLIAWGTSFSYSGYRSQLDASTLCTVAVTKNVHLLNHCGIGDFFWSALPCPLSALARAAAPLQGNRLPICWPHPCCIMSITTSSTLINAH